MNGDESEKAYTDEVQASNAAVMESCMVMVVVDGRCLVFGVVRITGQFYYDDDDTCMKLCWMMSFGARTAGGRDPLVRRRGGGERQNAIKFPNPRFSPEGCYR